MKLKYIVFLGSVIFAINSLAFIGAKIGPVGAGIGEHGVGIGVDKPDCVNCNYEACPDECYDREDKGAFLGIRGEKGRQYRESTGDVYRSQRQRR